MEQLFVIADIAGQFDALMRLVARVPETCKILAVGDLVDRGPKSYEVVSWFMKNHERADSLCGNHEHMMIDFCEGTGIYDWGVWHSNGGGATIRSYDETKVPKSHIQWLTSRSLYKFIPGDESRPQLLVSHAALAPYLSPEQAAAARDWSSIDFMHGFLWNRGEPAKIGNTFQICGHNSHWGLRRFDDWAICIDQSRIELLTGFLWPSGEIITEPYSEPKQIESENSAL